MVFLGGAKRAGIALANMKFKQYLDYTLMYPPKTPPLLPVKVTQLDYRVRTQPSSRQAAAEEKHAGRTAWPTASGPVCFFGALLFG